MGKIVHGNSSFGYAPINSTEDGVYSFGNPVMLPVGLVSTSIEVDQDTNKIYADNIVWCNVKGAKVRTATCNFRNVPIDYAEYLGFKLNANGGLSDTGLFPSHCIFFETIEEDCETGVKTRKLHYLYNVQGSEPTEESETDEESVDAREIEVEYSCNTSSFVVDDDGNYVQYFTLTRTDENASLYDNFKSKIILPTDEIQQPVPTPTYTYEEVTPTGDEDPSELGWYELVDGNYVLSEDTTVDDSKTYYERIES